MLHNFYHRVLSLAASRSAPLWLAVIAFAEASFFPVPPDALLIPMALARPDRAVRYALICTGGSVAGGLLGYFIGYALFEQIARRLLAMYHYQAAYGAFETRVRENAVYIILVKGLLPIPYKIVTIAMGAVQVPLATFILASIVTRGARFLLWAVLLKYYGERARVFIDRRLPAILAVGVTAGVVGILMLKYI